ncbi:hypothetical protein [Streptomyces sp. NPDC093223]|uniref:hypothetical protein n=1 Tax=Streptomyces sp. NPDC093223 TaxID=3366033 RepID=UPI00382A2E9F
MAANRHPKIRTSETEKQMQNDQQRYQLGAREESGRYPVRVDGKPAGSVYRRHGSWFPVMPGHPMDGRSTNRYGAAELLVAAVDQGKRPTIPVQAARPHTPRALDVATRSYTYLIPDLRPTLPNLVRAAEATARLAELAWKPLAGYPGADQPWMMQCLLCGWEGRRFWSHLRGRNGNGIPRPINRHPGCLPVADHAELIAKHTAELTVTCECEFKHPTTVHKAIDVLSSLQNASAESPLALLYARPVLEPCTAASQRAVALRCALNHLTAQK